jgi:hypothetical protein
VNAQDVTFLGGRGEGNDAGGYTPPASGPKKTTSSKKSDDVVIEDIGDEPINLEDIPF